MANVRHRRWCFTLNNYTEDEYNAINALEPSYIVVGKEGQQEGQTPHLQGYVEWKDNKTMTACKRQLSRRAHVEVAKGSPQQASDYCKKEGAFYEKGERCNQGKRTELVRATETIRERGMDALLDEAPELFVKFANGFSKLEAHYSKHRTHAPKVIWLWGNAGCGKTRLAVGNCTPNDYFIWQGGKFWNGYHQQQRVIIDDFAIERGSDYDYRYRFLLRLLDRYNLEVEIKGSHMKFNSPMIFITCEFPPDHFWQHNELAQVTRRLHAIHELNTLMDQEDLDHLHSLYDLPEVIDAGDNLPEDVEEADQDEYVNQLIDDFLPEDNQSDTASDSDSFEDDYDIQGIAMFKADR